MMWFFDHTGQCQRDPNTVNRSELTEAADLLENFRVY